MAMALHLPQQQVQTNSGLAQLCVVRLQPTSSFSIGNLLTLDPSLPALTPAVSATRNALSLACPVRAQLKWTPSREVFLARPAPFDFLL